MDIKEKDLQVKEVEDSKDLLKLNINYNKENYLLKIFISKDNKSIIFKLEKEKIRTYYYYGKFYLNELKKMNKKFNSDNNINNIFINLKLITQNYICSLEKKSLKIKILFIKNNTEKITIYSLRKKIVEQKRLNFQLNEEIQENKFKIKFLKKQIAKLDKIIQNKNNLIDNINNNIIKLTKTINNININTNNSDNIIENSKNKNNSDKVINKDYKDKEIKDINILNKKEEKLLKKNLLSKKRFQKNDINKESKIYNINISQKDNKLNQNQKDFIFDFDNIEVLKNKKIFETLITLNIFTVVIIIYLLVSINDLKSGMLFRMKDQGLLKKVTILNILDNYLDEKINGIKNNIIDFKLNNNNENEDDKFNIFNNNDENNIKPRRKIAYIIRRSKKQISLLYNEREKRFFRIHIKRRTRNRVRDIELELKYNSLNPDKYSDIYNNYQNDYDVLILMRTNDGKRYFIFNINNFKYNVDENNIREDYAGYVFNDDKIIEINLKEFYIKYIRYLQNVYIYIKNKKIDFENKTNNTSIQILGDINIFEIYQVKYIK